MSHPMRELDLPPIADGFGFEEEHDLARQAARRFLSERCPMTAIRRLADAASGPDPALHRAIAELGWLELAVGDPLHLGLLFEEMGRVLWPSPFFACTLALRLMAQATESAELERWRSAIVSGDEIATVVLADSGTCVAEPDSSGFVLRGELRHVLAGADARVAFVACEVPGDGLGVFAIELPSPGVTAEREISVDVTRPSARLRLERARVPREARLGGDMRTALERVRTAAAALLACEMVGSAEAVLEKTRLYAIER
jgi:alkylation response protein AidB-like acyl-CoA dehydrogenase